VASDPSAAGDAFVLDASVTATWLLPDEHTDASRRLFAGVRSGNVELHAPDLWLVECGNIIVNAVRRKRTTAANALALWQVLDSVRTRCQLYQPEPPQVRAALALALERKLSLYDATYLWLALSLSLPLLTQDSLLARAAKAQGVVVVSLESFA
jgi:predicted nucleic acid-binding protein